MEKINKASRILSAALRHKPEILGIELDKNGWTDITILLENLITFKGIDLAYTDLCVLVQTNDKKRFVINEEETKIRANQGHSVEVDLQLKNKRPPIKLYHGTVDKAVKEIMKTGMKKMKRHAVHLSVDIPTAINVGSRRGDAILLEIQSARMYIDGYKFQESANGVWLTDEVPAKYIRRL